MSLWWLGALTLLLVVLPVVAALLYRLLAAGARVRDAATDVLAEIGGLDDDLEPVPGLLATTAETSRAVQVGGVRYADSVRKLLEE